MGPFPCVGGGNVPPQEALLAASPAPPRGLRQRLCPSSWLCGPPHAFSGLKPLVFCSILGQKLAGLSWAGSSAQFQVTETKMSARLDLWWGSKENVLLSSFRLLKQIPCSSGTAAPLLAVARVTLRSEVRPLGQAWPPHPQSQ